MADKDFVIKNGLVVGDTATINGVQIDPSGVVSGQILKFDGTKFAPASEGGISGTVYSTTIGDGTNSTYVITHGFGTRNVLVVIRNATSPYEVINARWEATTTNTITVDFSSPVASETVTVSVYGAVTGISTGSSYYQTIGNGTDSSFILTHNFNTRDVVVTARNAASPYEVINARWEAETTNTVLVDFSSAPSSNSVRVGVYATISGGVVTSFDDLSDITITSPTSGDFLKWNGTAWVNQSGVVNTNDTGTVTSTMIANGTIVDADINASAAIDKTKISGTAVTIADTGTVTSAMIADATIVNGDISTSAAITHSKLANATAGQILLGTTTTGVITATTVSGDITINGAGVATISANSVALGTDTTGNYMSDVTQGTGVIITHTPGEGSNATIAIGQAVGINASVTFANITATETVTLAADPSSALQAATKQYVDNVASGINFHQSVVAATIGNLAGTYNNGTSGIGATLTKATNGSIGTIDGASIVVGSRILVKSQTDSKENGIYTITAVGSVSAPWVITRATDADNSVSGEMASGDFCFVMSGNTNAGYGFINNSPTNPIVIGTDNITYTAFNAAQTLTNGSGINLVSNVLSVDTATIQARVTDVSDTEIGYLNGVTSAIQTQLNNKQAIVANVSDTEIGYLDGVTSAIQTQLNNKQAIIANVSDTEIGYLDGVTSAIQTQLNTKASTGKAIAMAIVFGG